MDKIKKILGVIPARYESTRFPGKALALINNKSMVQWVYEGSKEVFDHLIVATDDERICDAIKNFGGNVMMTSGKHLSGTERCLEVVETLEQNSNAQYDVVVNIQGDEPLIKKEQLFELINCFEKKDTQIATLVKSFGEDEDPKDPNAVKVVIDKSNNALYFSRSPIPFYRNNTDETNLEYLKHIGLYGFKTAVLKKICKLPVSILERAESLEQLRWLENGFSIMTHYTEYMNIGIDTPEDLEKLKSYLK